MSHQEAIVVENLSKSYLIRQAPQACEQVSGIRRLLGSPARRFRTLSGSDEHSRTFWALDDVSFTVRPGEVVGLIGRNGAGKSTLLKVLSRITPPTGGRATLRGRLGSLLEVGTGFHRELTGRENVYLSGALLGMRKSEIDRCFDGIVDFAEVGAFIDTPVKRYSSGMYVRLAFAVAAHLQPEILLVDEVLAVGDIQFQKKCLGKMDDVARSGRTVLFVSHNLAAVQSLCTRGIYLENGKLASMGPVQQAIRAYLDSVAQLAENCSLADRSDRVGNGLLRFTRVDFLDPQTHQPLGVVMSGQPVQIAIHYNCTADHDLDDVVVSISFQTPSGLHLFGCDNDAVGRVIRVKPGKGTFICDIPKWPLSRGRVSFDVAAYQCRKELDWVRDAGMLDVEAGVYYGTGKLPVASRQGVYVDYDYLPEPALA
jgi:lipopolysaccharide transport system ATP-binding protein